MTEYVKLSKPEVLYGQKNLLQVQLSLLEISKHYKAYQELRKQELLLKISLKNKIEQAKESLAILEKMLPKIKLPGRDQQQKKESLEIFSKKDLSLQEEIDYIRQKLSKLK